MTERSYHVSRLATGLAGLLALLLPAILVAGIDSADVAIHTPMPSTDGRLSLVITGSRTTSGGQPVALQAVRAGENRLEVVLNSTPGVLPAFSTYRISVLIDGLEPGDHEGVVLGTLSDAPQETEVATFSFSIAGAGENSHDVAFRLWPETPTIFDRVWAIVDPVATCAEIELVEWGFNRLRVNEVPAACIPDVPPRSRLVDLGVLDAGLILGSFSYALDGQWVALSPLTLDVRDQLSPRLSGSWYNPEQPGHGLSLEVLDSNRLLAYWYTFDADGEPLWLIAIGPYQEQGLTRLNAVRVEGGRFPPAFDPDHAQTRNWGELEIEFAGCNEAVLRWMPSATGFSDGEMSLSRLTRTAGQDCDGPPPQSALTPDWFQHAHWYYRLEDDTLIAPRGLPDS